MVFKRSSNFYLFYKDCFIWIFKDFYSSRCRCYNMIYYFIIFCYPLCHYQDILRQTKMWFQYSIASIHWTIQIGIWIREFTDNHFNNKTKSYADKYSNVQKKRAQWKYGWKIRASTSLLNLTSLKPVKKYQYSYMYCYLKSIKWRKFVCNCFCKVQNHHKMIT